MMVSNNAGFILRKDACTKEQQDFIREKCVGRRKNKVAAQVSPPPIPMQDEGFETDNRETEAPLFTAKTKYTFKELLKFNIALVTKSVRTYITLGVVFVLITVFFYSQYGYHGLRLSLAVIALTIGLTIFLTWFGVYRGWKTNTLMQNYEEKYEFYRDRVDTFGVSGKTGIPYDKIYKINETKQNFYIMIATNQGMILNKSECSDELVDFLRDKKKV